MLSTIRQCLPSTLEKLMLDHTDDELNSSTL